MKWYKMDCDAQENLDMRKLVDEWGWDWYGRWWAICGKVGMLVNERRQTFALQTNNGEPFPLKLLANDLGTNAEKLSDFLEFLADNRLIDPETWKKQKLIFIPKLKERADEYTKKFLSKSGHIEEQKQKTRNRAVLYESDFELLWKYYPNRAGKKNALRHFNATVKTDEDVANIKKALRNYLKSGNVKRGFVKNGSTWFNEWQDWVNPSSVMITGNSNGRQQQTQQPTSYDSMIQCPKCTLQHNEKKCPSCGTPRPEKVNHHG